MLNATDFTRELMNLSDQYRADNTWVGAWRTGSWNDDDTMARYIQYAFNLYRATATNMLKLTLLGGTEIRLLDPYIRNFGVTAANGIQDQETERCVYREMGRRTARAMFPNRKAANPDRNAIDVMRSGSILSEKGWTPILNDALIIGAATARQEFALAFTNEERDTWTRLNAGKINKFAVNNVAKFGESLELISAWKQFFNASSKMFFDAGNPRVFSRELLGLKMFGYKPEFTWHQLTFRPPKGGVARPTFSLYLKELRKVNFHSADRAKIMAGVSEFLFNDERALV